MEKVVFVSVLSLLFFFLFPDSTTKSWVNCAFHHDLHRTADLTLFYCQVLFFCELISFIGLFMRA